ncbi:MAG: DUF6398 domain-containing protein [bacterium]
MSTKVTNSEKVPKEMQSIFENIVNLTDKFCEDYLNKEYAQLAHKATAALCRKRLSPLREGKINTWACGIIYALGFANFLFDKNEKPYINATDLCEKFGVGKSTGASKSKIVRDTLKISQMDPNWCLPSKMDDNPLAWQIMYNGFIVDVRSMPLNIQEIAYKKGLIPYIPNVKEIKD